MRSALMHALFAYVALTVTLSLSATAGKAMRPTATGLYLPLASQDRSGFGDAIVYSPRAYTPPGIFSLAYSPLVSQNESGFGDALVFAPAAYTPSGIAPLHPVVATH